MKSYQIEALNIIIPDGWTPQQHLRTGFVSTGGKVAFSKGKRLMVNFAVASGRFILDRDKRESEIKRFLKVTAIVRFRWSAKPVATGRLLAGERNTAWCELIAKSTFRPSVVNGLVEAVHNNVCYTVQYHFEEGARSELNAVLETLEFVR